MNVNFKKLATLLLSALITGIYTGCQPEEFGDGNGLDAPDLTASFTVTPVEGRINTYLLEADPRGVLGVKWDKGDGAGALAGITVDTVFYPDAGTYTIELTAIGKGGELATATKEVVVATSDPVAGNLIVGSKMEAGDEDAWTTLEYSAGVNPVFKNGKLVFEGGGWGHAGVYQAVEVIANKKYRLDMIVSGSGASETWFEVYIGTTVPVGGGGNDYNDGGKRLALSTWTGCGNTAFAGKLTELACEGSLMGDVGGVIEFPASGTHYLVIRTGGANLGTDGISVDNVELRGIE